MSTPVFVGLGLALIGYSGRYLARYSKLLTENLSKTSSILSQGLSSKYYKGGFDPRMNRREAALILGVSPNATRIRIRDAYKRLIVLNHPDRGGSPYVAAKINEAKEIFENGIK